MQNPNAPRHDPDSKPDIVQTTRDTDQASRFEMLAAAIEAGEHFTDWMAERWYFEGRFAS